jgi:hypothetical protein
MPINTFDVESYTVLTNQAGTTVAGAWRNLGLTSTALSHGIRTRASVFFFDQPGTIGVVYNIDQPNYNGQTAYANCRKGDYADWYDLLRNEQPLKCRYAYEGPEFDPSQPVRNLYWIQLYTGSPEPPGEGSEEIQAKLFPASILEMLKKG